MYTGNIIWSWTLHLWKEFLINLFIQNRLLLASTPYILQKSSLGGKTIDGIIRFAIFTDISAQGEGLIVSGDDTIRINASNVDLNRGMVFGGDETVGSRAII